MTHSLRRTGFYHYFPLPATGTLTLSSVWHVLALKKKAVSSDIAQHRAAHSQIMLPLKDMQGRPSTTNHPLIIPKVQQLEMAHYCETPQLFLGLVSV